MSTFADLHVRRYDPQPLEWKGRFVRNWFSNFETDGHPIHYLGRETRCLEVAFVAAKNPFDLAFVDRVYAAGASGAKKLGRTTTLRTDWENVNIAAMDFFLRQKWQPGTTAADRLMSMDTPCCEICNWGDNRWGCVLPSWEGRNALGLLLQRIQWELLDGYLEAGVPEDGWAEYQVYLVAALNTMQHGQVILPNVQGSVSIPSARQGSLFV